MAVDAEHAGRRIDNFLTGMLKGVPRSRIYRILRRGEVRVNGGRVQQDYRLRPGDRLRIPPVRSAISPSEIPNGPLKTLLEESPLYEDEGLLILNKPSGLPVHGGTGYSFGVIELLRAIRRSEPYLELVHRLDRGTSGCLMIAKRPRVLRHLHELLRGGAIDKRYVTLVQGRWSGAARVIDEGLKKNVLRAGERVVQVSLEGKAAQTYMAPIELWTSASLMQVKLWTGRTHQIRVHAAHVGHPVAGDTKYGDPGFNRLMREYGLRHLFLHANRLELRLPGAGPRVSAQAPLPDHLAKVLARLRAGSEEPCSA